MDMAINFQVSGKPVDFDVSQDTVLFGDISPAGGGGGTTDHRDLSHRDSANQHPISAITGLEAALENASGFPKVTEANNNQIMKVVDGSWALSAFYSITSNDAGGNTLNL